MRVAYDGTGNPSFISTENSSSTVIDKTSPKSDIISPNAYTERSGLFSYFTDTVGQDENHTFGNYDCATSLSVDNCALGTTIYSRDLSNGRTATLYKWDAGNLPYNSRAGKYVVLDLRPYVFSQVFGHDLDIGLIVGEYSHS